MTIQKITEVAKTFGNSSNGQTDFRVHFTAASQ
ncbi:hypothetical protein TBK1r_57180 [Stieleria magnilauensis]|uniref:Uncharacterized protein n=1 Tax=Stieleria magnilauensis TaxID=2527963 RepID=A0ABX5XXF2_9BACT|nr:hypothetical protein TBK1r_57180 [Planctomycetes bacterium TBK1r]